MENKNYKIRYTKELITENTRISPDGFSSISFENVGEDGAVLDGVIPLNNNGVAREFNNEPYVQIESYFTIEFDNVNEDKRVVVVRSYTYQ